MAFKGIIIIFFIFYLINFIDKNTPSDQVICSFTILVTWEGNTKGFNKWSEDVYLYLQGLS